MRAVMSGTYGAAPEVREVPEPVPGVGEVRVRVRASSLNAIDVRVADSFRQGRVEHPYPVVLGRDFAGTIDQVGREVSGFMPGEEVFGVVVKPTLGDGSFGEYVVVSQDIGLTPLPAGLDYADAGVLGLAGSAALAAVDAVAPEAGETVLVSGATGGVGGYAVQLLAARGATVIATAEPGAAADRLRDLGATHTVDHRTELVGQVGDLAPDGVAAVIHLAGDPDTLAGLVGPGGRFVSTLGVGSEQLTGREVMVSAVNAHPDRTVLDHLATEATAGRLRTTVTRHYTLDQVPQAFDDFSAPGTVGKLAVTID